MTNPKLARDYLLRSRKRLKAVALLLDEEAFADVVRESQEVVDLLLKAVLRSFGLEVPFSHDVSEVLEAHAARLPTEVRAHLPRWTRISRQLRKDRELAFYGSEDVTPSSFYSRADAEEARAMVEEILATAEPWIR
jgi:HEPN domain-containing protein